MCRIFTRTREIVRIELPPLLLPLSGRVLPLLVLHLHLVHHRDRLGDGALLTVHLLLRVVDIQAGSATTSAAVAAATSSRVVASDLSVVVIETIPVYSATARPATSPGVRGRTGLQGHRRRRIEQVTLLPVGLPRRKALVRWRVLGRMGWWRRVSGRSPSTSGSSVGGRGCTPTGGFFVLDHRRPLLHHEVRRKHVLLLLLLLVCLLLLWRLLNVFVGPRPDDEVILLLLLLAHLMRMTVVLLVEKVRRGILAAWS